VNGAEHGAVSGAAVEVEDLRRSFGETTALDGVSLSVRRGELFGLLGPNGGGKTTLFRILSTVLPQTSGRARVMGFDVETQQDAARGAIGVVFQAPSLDKFLRVEENLRHQGHLYGLRGARLAARIDACLALTGIAEKRREKAGTLSGGQKRRVELAKGLLHEPGLLLLDEPTTGLDPAARHDLWDHLAKLRATGVTSLVTTHLLEEAERCDRIAILDRGKVVAEGTPAELRASIPGQVMSAVPRSAADLDALRKAMEEKLRVTARVAGGAVHVEAPPTSGLLPDLGIEVASVTVGQPTLEHVFLRATGRQLG
jgi:ABC-2 type transport system ATP-binding protein